MGVTGKYKVMLEKVKVGLDLLYTNREIFLSLTMAINTLLSHTGQEVMGM